MSWTWIEQKYYARSDEPRLHILVGLDEKGQDTYLAFINVEPDGFKAMVPDLRITVGKPPPWHYTHDTLQEAKDYCIAELVRRRLS